MKTAQREWARDLRRHRAMSVKEIARLVGVAPSSVSVWVRDVPLTPEQLESLRLRNPAYNGQLRGANRNAERWRARRSGYQDDGREMAKHGSWLYVAGVMLYWAEGDKTHCNAARISNSDPEVSSSSCASSVNASGSRTNGSESTAISSQTISHGRSRSNSSGSTPSIYLAAACASPS